MDKYVLLTATKELEEKTRNLIIEFHEVESRQSTSSSKRTYLKFEIKDEPICTAEESFELSVEPYHIVSGYNFPQIVNEARTFVDKDLMNNMWIQLRADGVIEEEPVCVRLGTMQIVAASLYSDTDGYLIVRRA